MSNYKAGDKVTIVLDNRDAEKFNEYGDEYTIIAHEPAPEPIVRYGCVYNAGYGYDTLECAKKEASKDVTGYVKVIFTGNDFTVEKVG